MFSAPCRQVDKNNKELVAKCLMGIFSQWRGGSGRGAVIRRQNSRLGIIGVAELCNKQTGAHFTKFDQNLDMAFRSYCGLATFHSLIYKKAADAQYI